MTRQEFETHINTLGSPGVHTAVSSSVVTNVDKVISARVGKVGSVGEDAIVNSYGITARQLLIKASSLPAPLERFDTVKVGGQLYVIDAVLPKLEVGTGFVMGWVCYAVGD